MILFKKNGISSMALILFFLLMPQPSLSQGMSNYELEQEINELKERIQGAGALSFSGAVEVEVSLENGYEGENTSDITLATVEFGIEAEVCEWASANVVFLWEEDDTGHVGVDEGTITVGMEEKSPFYLTSGKFVVPFGSYETNMISDPLTLELGETSQSAVQLGIELPSSFTASVYIFNGDIDEDGEDDTIKCFGANLRYVLEGENMDLDIGAGWINNIADTDGLGDWIKDNNYTLKDYVGGFTGHVILNLAPYIIIAEYVAAMDDIEFINNPKLEAPSAYSLELGYTFEMIGKETTVGIAYQGTDKCEGILPETRLLASIGVGLGQNVGVGLEYAHDDGYSNTDDGTGDEADIVTVQLALEF